MNAIGDYLHFIISAFACCGTLFAPLLLIPITLRDPLLSKRDRTKPIDFSLLDISYLFILMSVTMAIVRFIYSTEPRPSGVPVIMTIYGGLTLILWWTTIRSLARANVCSKLHRSILVLFIAPIAWVVSFILPGSICMFVLGVYWNDVESKWLAIIFLVSLSGTLFLIGSRLFVRSIYSNISLRESPVSNGLKNQLPTAPPKGSGAF